MFRNINEKVTNFNSNYVYYVIQWNKKNISRSIFPFILRKYGLDWIIMINSDPSLYSEVDKSLCWDCMRSFRRLEAVEKQC